MKNWFQMYFSSQYGDKQIFSVCWNLEETGGDGICDHIRYVEVFRVLPVPLSYLTFNNTEYWHLFAFVEVDRIC